MPNNYIEIINGREQRRRWSLDDKLQIVAESREPDASVRAEAARHDVYFNLLSTWRNLERRGRLGGESPACFMPVRLIKAMPPTGARVPSAAAAADTIEITLPDGSRVRVGNDVSLATLRRVMTDRRHRRRSSTTRVTAALSIQKATWPDQRHLQADAYAGFNDLYAPLRKPEPLTEAGVGRMAGATSSSWPRSRGPAGCGSGAADRRHLRRRAPDQ